MAIVAGTGHSILGNSIHPNFEQAIDLDDDGVTSNDSGDGDVGTNELQNFPVIASAVNTGTQVVIVGMLNSTPGTSFRVEFFANSGDGEAKTFLDFVNVTTDASGNAPRQRHAPGRSAPATSSPPARRAPTARSLVLRDLGARAERRGRTRTRSPARCATTSNANANVAEAGTLAFANATVQLYVDDGDGVIDAGDTLFATTTSDAAGLYSFTGLFSNTYYVVVDSKTLSAAPNVWAEQTYGAAGAANNAAGTTFTGAAGALYGGRSAVVSDNAAALTTAEHVTRVAVAGATVDDVDSGFSFNAVTSARGDNVDDDGANPRMQQGTLRQFILNANAIVGPNAMRFVPATAANVDGGDGLGNGNDYWRITLATALPQITDAGTVVDGTAYQATVNGAVRNDNAGLLGAGGTVGVGAVALAQVAAPSSRCSPTATCSRST